MAAVDMFYHHMIPRAGESFILSGNEGHHAQTVRRKHIGEHLCVTNGQGELAYCIIEDISPGKLTLLCQHFEQCSAPNPKITVVQALVKGDRADAVFDDLTQAGADRIIPWQAERSVRKIEEKQSKVHQRWLNIAMSAAKQSRRTWFPEIERPMTSALLIAELPHMLAPDAQIIVLDEDATKSLAQSIHASHSNSEICLIVGPEGGLSDHERALFHGIGAQSALLGSQIIRSWLAGVIAIGATAALTDRWELQPIHQIDPSPVGD